MIISDKNLHKGAYEKCRNRTIIDFDGLSCIKLMTITFRTSSGIYKSFIGATFRRSTQYTARLNFEVIFSKQDPLSRNLKMSLSTVVLSVCFFALISTAYGNNPPLPVAVNGLQNQCLAAGYAGACNDINFSIGGINCASVMCKRISKTKNGVTVSSIGHAARGTKCGAPRDKKICENGWCVNLGSKDVPHQIGPNPSMMCRQYITPRRRPRK